MTSLKRPDPATSARAKRRGLLDTVLMAGLVYAVYAMTPLGALAETGIRVARGQHDHPNLWQTFRGQETAVDLSSGTATPADATARIHPAVAAAATAHAVDADLVAALVAAQGSCAGAACTVTTPPRAALMLPGGAGAQPQLSVDDLGRALANAHQATSGVRAHAANGSPTGAEMTAWELATEALYVGPLAVRLAVDQATRSRLPAPADVEQHAEFLPPSVRRGPLQAALSGIAVYRLRRLSWPAAEGFRVTSPFGERIHPVTGLRSFHNGTDLGVPVGTPLVAADRAQVKRQSEDSVSGRYVVLDLGLGIETVYCHLSEPLVHAGDRVDRRGTVGHSGATGRVTGPHLHYILRVEGTPKDAESLGERARPAG